MTAKKKRLTRRSVRRNQVELAAIRDGRRKAQVSEMARLVADQVARLLNVDAVARAEEQARQRRWHGAHGALLAMLESGAIKDQYVLFIRERLAMRGSDPVVEINGIAILPPVSQ